MIKNDILPAAIYNTLPNIRDVFNVPEANLADIADLKHLLKKHNLSDRVRIKLVHIHFRLEEGEIFSAREIKVPKHGSINIMQPLLASQHQPLYGHHYFVDDQGNLLAYEYMDAPGPDLSGQQSFIQEFCQLIQERGLRRKLGLSLRHAGDNFASHELEYPAIRTCIDVPIEIRLPYSEDSFNTTTEFMQDWPMSPEGFEVVGESGAVRQVPNHYQHYTHHKHYTHCQRTDDDNGLFDGTTNSDKDFSGGEAMDGLYIRYGVSGLPLNIELAGIKLDQSSGLYEIVSYINNNA